MRSLLTGFRMVVNFEFIGFVFGILTVFGIVWSAVVGIVVLCT